MCPQCRVRPAGGQQFPVAALLDDPTGIHHEDAIHRLDGGQPVGDDQGRPARHRLGQRLLDVDLALAVQGARGLIEYEDPGEWRRIADANGIDDPFRLEPGKKLIIPPILR